MRIIAYGLGMALLIGCTNGVAQESQAQPVRDTAGTAASGTETSRDYSVRDFDHVSLMTPDNVEINRGSAFAVTATGDSRILDELEITVEDGELEIAYRDREERNWRRPDVPAARITVTLPALNGVTLAGSGDMRVGSFSAQNFNASVAGSGDIIIAALQADSADLSVAGSGNLTIAGTARDIDLSVAGSGNVSASDFRAEEMDVSIAGSGDVDAYVTGRVTGSFVGSGDVAVRGGARCRSTTIGSGRLRCS